MGIVIPTDFHMFQDGYCTTNQLQYYQPLLTTINHYKPLLTTIKPL